MQTNQIEWPLSTSRVSHDHRGLMPRLRGYTLRAGRRYDDDDPPPCPAVIMPPPPKPPLPAALAIPA